MKLPNVEYAIINKSKIVDYLLSDIHPVGKTKSFFFKRFGFTVEQWKILSDTLLRHARNNDVAKMEVSRFGIRYIVEGPIPTPDGREIPLRTIWFLENEKEISHFVTAYPLKKG